MKMCKKGKKGQNEGNYPKIILNIDVLKASQKVEMCSVQTFKVPDF